MCSACSAAALLGLLRRSLLLAVLGGGLLLRRALRFGGRFDDALDARRDRLHVGRLGRNVGRRHGHRRRGGHGHHRRGRRGHVRGECRRRAHGEQDHLHGRDGRLADKHLDGAVGHVLSRCVLRARGTLCLNVDGRRRRAANIAHHGSRCGAASITRDGRGHGAALLDVDRRGGGAALHVDRGRLGYDLHDGGGHRSASERRDGVLHEQASCLRLNA
mmetsp:Transcript_19440/g.51155  ORF Transcript_19440/g.51155 Transcript_19440/m.51155 type:complete len:217 (-) Transcript_19440:7-657(-)